MSAPQTLVSSLSSTRFEPARFWLVRIATFLILAVALYGIQLILTPKLSIYDLRIIVSSTLFATLAVSLNLINGVTGQFSMGHAAFYLAGAIIAGKLSTVFYKSSHMPGWLWLPLMVLAGGLGAALIGLLVGIPSLRLRGDYLAVMTMGFGEIARNFVINQDGGPTAIGKLNLGGSYGLQNVPKLTEIYQLILLLVLAIALSRNLLKTAHGLSFLAVREDELAADATGVHATRIKVVAFCVGAALAGMAGALLAHYNRSVSPDDFKMDVSFMLVAMVVIGGTGSITGAAIAGISLKVLEEGLRALPVIPAIALYGFIIALIVVMAVYKLINSKLGDSTQATIDKVATGLGAIGLLLLSYGAYRTYSAKISVVIKVALILIVLAMIFALLSRAGRGVGLPRFGRIVGLLGIAAGCTFATRLLLTKIPSINELLGPITYQAADLRWAIFSTSLVVVMLTRPQGLLSHHEFSWDLFGGWLQKKPIEANS